MDCPFRLILLWIASLVKKWGTRFLKSVSDPGFLSRIPDPDFYLSRIPDPKTATKERGEQKLVVIPFFVATNFTKLKIISCLNC
jgi:hypothetical protein